MNNNINYLFNLIKKHKWEELTKELKKKIDYNLNIKDEQDNYLLSYAVLFNKINVIKLLLDKGANIDIIDHKNRTLLYIAIKYGYDDIIDLFINYNKNNIGISIFDILDINNNVPLHYAIKFNNYNVTKKLLDNGANPNNKNNKGYNSLHIAIYNKNIDIINLILNYNIDINMKTNTGENALHIACNLQLIDVVNLLIKNKIDIDAQDYNNEFSSLHYCVNINNIKLINILIKNNVNINTQDIIGNTPIHYAIIENNVEILLLLNSVKNIDLNLWNYDGNIPLNIVLNMYNDNNIDNINDYYIVLLKDSDLNIQNNEGNSCLHLICKYKNLWKNNKETLIKKKLDVFILNKLKIRPIDNINNDDIDDFIDLLTKSYLYRLQHYKGMWSNDWENICKKNINYNKLSFEDKKIIDTFSKEYKINKNKNNICYEIINKKIKNMYYNEKLKTCEKSYPIKNKLLCLNLNNDKQLNLCTFTGTTLDVLIGLIYLIKKYNLTCTTLSVNFFDNKELCNFYNSIGLLPNTKCDFLNFELIWIKKKIFFSDNFYLNFKKCIKNTKKRFIIIPLGIELIQGSHANYILYDKNNNELERFEPHGYSIPMGFNYEPTLLDKILEKRFKEIIPNIKYIRPKDYLPKIGFQLLDIYEDNKKKIGDPDGFCALWAIWYIDMRLSYHNLERSKLVKIMIKSIKSQGLSFRNIIRNYSKNIINIRNKIFDKANIDINDWLNDNINDKQADIIKNELVKQIELFDF
jgi:ankyrin repeat protein